MKNFAIIILILTAFSCTKSKTSVNPNENLVGKYELVKIYNHPTCCNGGESTIKDFSTTNTIVINETSITEFEENKEINRFDYEKKVESIADRETTVLNILNLNSANKTTFQTIGWMKKLLVSRSDKYLILGVRWGKEGELTDYYFQKK